MPLALVAKNRFWVLGLRVGIYGLGLGFWGLGDNGSILILLGSPENLSQYMLRPPITLDPWNSQIPTPKIPGTPEPETLDPNTRKL